MRRRTILGLVYGLPALMGGTVLTSLCNYLLGKTKESNNSWVDAGELTQLTPGAPRCLVFDRVVTDGWDVKTEKTAAWVVIDEGNQIKAFSPFCTHLGCAYNWSAGKQSFTCPCHGSAFDRDGNVQAGPAARPLDRFTIKVEGQRLWLGPVQSSSQS